MSGYYAAIVGKFLDQSNSEMLGILLSGTESERFSRLHLSAAEAWKIELDVLKKALGEAVARNSTASNWGIILEYVIPRRQKRADAVLLMGNVVCVLEFKTSVGDVSSCRQVEDYALDLRDFHSASKGLRIVPLLVAPEFLGRIPVSAPGDVVAQLQWCAPQNLGAELLSIAESFRSSDSQQINVEQWNRGQYHAVPTIVEAALAIFAGMEVREIAHSHASAENLTETVDEIVKLANAAKERTEKLICFVSGVPGSGKTLAGLRAVHDPELQRDPAMAPTFLSGNGPLVKILRRALAEDMKDRQKMDSSQRLTTAERARRVKTLIENVHVFARTHFDDPDKAPPPNHVIVFDEAQRAWNEEQNTKKFKRALSEPEMILEIMSRLSWALVVALIGGGQEINTGEAGLQEWGKALVTKFPEWKVYASEEAIIGGPSVAGSRLCVSGGQDVTKLAALHLPVSQRSYRAQAITEWSNSLLNGRLEHARDALKSCRDFPVYWTRNLGLAKAWLSLVARGTSRSGLVVSSGATRLRAYGLETSTSFHRDYPYEHWFLRARGDVRSSYQLEVAATEFEIQGLELDFVGLCWCNDLLWDSGKWVCRRFSQSRWLRIKKDSDIQFLINAYRVLLTRARQGMVIWVPSGVEDDPTLNPNEFDCITDALLASGIENLPVHNAALAHESTTRSFPVTAALNNRMFS